MKKRYLPFAKRYIYMIVRTCTINGYSRTLSETCGWFKSEKDCQKECDELNQLHEEGYNYRPQIVYLNLMYTPAPKPLTDKERAKIRNSIYKLARKKLKK